MEASVSSVPSQGDVPVVNHGAPLYSWSKNKEWVTSDYGPAAYRKEILKTYRVKTKAMRVNGPFRVQTPVGIMECADGYLIMDYNGNLYPVDKDEFEAHFKEDDAE